MTEMPSQNIAHNHVNRRSRFLFVQMYNFAQISSSDERRVGTPKQAKTCMRSKQANEFVRQLEDIFVICKQQTRIKLRDRLEWDCLGDVTLDGGLHI